MKFAIEIAGDALGFGFAACAWRGAKEYAHEWHYGRLAKRGTPFMAIREGRSSRWKYLTGQDEIDAYYRDLREKRDER